jgi:hypothetical protein
MRYMSTTPLNSDQIASAVQDVVEFASRREEVNFWLSHSTVEPSTWTTVNASMKVMTELYVNTNLPWYDNAALLLLLIITIH